MSTCGQCIFGRLVPQDLKVCACLGAPPTPVAVPTPKGMQITMMRPMVGATDEACALFRERMAIEMPLALPEGSGMKVVGGGATPAKAGNGNGSN